MIDSNSLNNLFNYRYKTIGDISGELFDIYRPNYATIDNLPTLRTKGAKFRMGIVRATSFAEPKVFGASFYDIFGNRALVQSGDIIVRGTLDNPNIGYPAVTVAHMHDQRALEGFRTSRRCHIVKSYNAEDQTYDYVCQNVYFDMMGSDKPHGDLTTNYEKSGQPIPAQRAIIYNRSSVNQEGMQLIETDYAGVPNGNLWYIDQITPLGPMMELILTANWRR